MDTKYSKPINKGPDWGAMKTFEGSRMLKTPKPMMTVATNSLTKMIPMLDPAGANRAIGLAG